LGLKWHEKATRGRTKKPPEVEQKSHPRWLGRARG
jgi:hypothetical protein